MVVSIPLGFFSGIGAASKKGILVKGGNYLEALKDSEVLELLSIDRTTYYRYKKQIREDLEVK